MCLYVLDQAGEDRLRKRRMPILQLKPGTGKSTIQLKDPELGQAKVSVGTNVVHRRASECVPVELALIRKSPAINRRHDGFHQSTRSAIRRRFFPDDDSNSDDGGKDDASDDDSSGEVASPTPTGTLKAPALATGRFGRPGAGPTPSGKPVYYTHDSVPTTTILLYESSATTTIIDPVGSSSSCLSGTPEAMSATASARPSLSASPHGVSNMARNAAIAGGTIGGIVIVVAAICLFWLFRRKRSIFDHVPSLSSGCIPQRRKRIQVIPNPPIQPEMSNTVHLHPPDIFTATWNPETTFAGPETPRTRARRFAGPLGLNPVTPPPTAARFPFPSSPNIREKFKTGSLAAKSFFRSANTSAQSLPGVSPRKRDWVQTRSSLALPVSGAYDRLPSRTGESNDRRRGIRSEEARAIRYFSQSQFHEDTLEGATERQSKQMNASQSLGVPQSNPNRNSEMTLDSTIGDWEPARFRSVPSWVRQQEEILLQKQAHRQQRRQSRAEHQTPHAISTDISVNTKSSSQMKTTTSKEPENQPHRPIPRDVPAAAVTSPEQPIRPSVEVITKRLERRTSEATDRVFNHHPGEEVQVPGLEGRRLRSGVLDKNIWGWGNSGN